MPQTLIGIQTYDTDHKSDKWMPGQVGFVDCLSPVSMSCDLLEQWFSAGGPWTSGGS